MRRVALLTIAAAVSAYAHHSLHGTYLMEQQVSVEGKVAKFLLRNPHSFIEIEVPQEDGPAQTWNVNGVRSRQLAARGIRWDTVKPGDEVTVTMSPAKELPEAIAACCESFGGHRTDSNGAQSPARSRQNGGSRQNEIKS